MPTHTLEFDAVLFDMVRPASLLLSDASCALSLTPRCPLARTQDGTLINSTPAVNEVWKSFAIK